MSINKYLNTLGLQPGVTEKEIRSAYRKLAKKYHPDVNPGEESRQKFIEINEAYNFLINVGPTPQNEEVSYGYNPSDIRDFEARRAWARAKAEEMEREARKELGIFLRKANRLISYFSILLLALNMLFLFDVQSETNRNKIESFFFTPLNKYGAPATQQNDFQIAQWNLDSFTVYERFSSTFISQPDNIWIYQTPVFKKLMQVEFDKNGKTKIMDNPAVAYNMIIFKVIVVLSTIIILINFATPYHSANKVTLSIIILFLSAIEGFMFILN